MTHAKNAKFAKEDDAKNPSQPCHPCHPGYPWSPRLWAESQPQGKGLRTALGSVLELLLFRPVAGLLSSGGS